MSTRTRIQRRESTKKGSNGNVATVVICNWTRMPSYTDLLLSLTDTNMLFDKNMIIWHEEVWFINKNSWSKIKSSWMTKKCHWYATGQVKEEAYLFTKNLQITKEIHATKNSLGKANGKGFDEAPRPLRLPFDAIRLQPPIKTKKSVLHRKNTVSKKVRFEELFF